MFGNCFFQPQDCAGDDNIYFFTNDDISDNCKLFISACIYNDTSKKYAFVEQFRQRDANSLIVKLPATPSGDPDWEYMDRYMTKIMSDEKGYAEKIEKRYKDVS